MHKRWQGFLLVAAALFLLLVAGGCRAPAAPTVSATPARTEESAQSVSTTPETTRSPNPTNTPTLTPAATPTPAPTPTPTSTPTPTPAPTAEAIVIARQKMALGDYLDAAVALRNFVTVHGQHPQAREAQFLQAQALILQGEEWQAIPLLEDLVQDETALAQFPEALFWLGRAIEGEQPQRAAELFAQYADLSPHLKAEILIRAGELWADTQAIRKAELTFHQARARAANKKTELHALEGLAAAALADNDLKAAAFFYRQILKKAQVPAYRAETFYHLGQVQQAAGQQEAAQESYQQAIHEDASSWYAYQALIELVNAGAPVEPRLRAEIDINAGATTPAITLLHELLATDPQDAEALYAMLARAYETDGNYAAAADAWRQTLLHAQESALQQQAWLGLGRSLWRQGLQEQARMAYLQAAEQVDDADTAATALWWAAVLAGQDEDKWRQAADDFMRLARTWPQHDYAAQAGFRAGLIYYRLGEHDTARALWQEHAASGDGDWQAAAHFWLGKLLEKQGDVTAARAQWQQTAQKWDANTFYGLRARQKAPAASTPTATPSPQEDTAQAAQRWVASFSAATPEVNDDELTNALARVEEWHRLGEDNRGHSELEALRQARADDANALWRIAHRARDLGYHDISIRAASRLVTLSGQPLHKAPLYVQKLIYPLAYRPLMLASAQNFQLDPALFYGLIWQESHFWAPATSSAGAMGLAQIMPATGEAAARQTRLELFTLDDLRKPRESLYLGAYILSQELERSQGDSFRALAAYNAGPGNADFWWQLAEQDPDLFVELISFRETQHYVRTITVQAQNYRRLYPDLLGQ